VLRIFLAGVLCSGLALGSAGSAAALDYQEPVVPPEFLLGGPPPVAPADGGGARLLTQAAGGVPAATAVPGVSTGAGDPPEAGSAGLSWARDGAPGPSQFIPGSQWSDGGGCAVWDWTSC
jgi:hypothetical protein